MAESNQGLPPLASNGVFTASASITIDAPRDVVWQVLMDWGSYHEWNPFVRNQCLTDGSRRPLDAAQQTPRAGAHLLIYPVHIPPSFDPPSIFPAGSAFEIITTMDPDNYRCAWENADYPTWLLVAERWQALVEVVEDGRKKTRYETIEVFRGWLAYVIKVVAGRGLQQGFDAMAEGLKERSEELHRRTNTTMHDLDPLKVSRSLIMLVYGSPLMSSKNNVEHNATSVYDAHGRQKNYVESAMQRRERIEFLKQREWVRRVTEWVRETSTQKDYPNFGRSNRSCAPFSFQDAGGGCQPSIVPFPSAEEEGEEPYIIYSSSPNSSLSSLSEEITPVLPLSSGPSPSLSLPAGGAQRRSPGHHRRCSSASLRGHTRKQSLSSICEVPEED